LAAWAAAAGNGPLFGVLSLVVVICLILWFRGLPRWARWTVSGTILGVVVVGGLALWFGEYLGNYVYDEAVVVFDEPPDVDWQWDKWTKLEVNGPKPVYFEATLQPEVRRAAGC